MIRSRFRNNTVHCIAGDSDDEAVTVTLPSVDRQQTARKTWSVAVEALTGERDTGSDAAAHAERGQSASFQNGTAAKRRARAATVSKQTPTATVKPEPAAPSVAGPESVARSTRSRKRAR